MNRVTGGKQQNSTEQGSIPWNAMRRVGSSPRLANIIPFFKVTTYNVVATIHSLKHVMSRFFTSQELYLGTVHFWESAKNTVKSRLEDATK